MEYAAVHDPVFIRTGTSGGFGILPGTVVIATEIFNDFLEPCLEIVSYCSIIYKLHSFLKSPYFPTWTQHSHLQKHQKLSSGSRLHSLHVEKPQANSLSYLFSLFNSIIYQNTYPLAPNTESQQKPGNWCKNEQSKDIGWYDKLIMECVITPAFRSSFRIFHWVRWCKVFK